MADKVQITPNNAQEYRDLAREYAPTGNESRMGTKVNESVGKTARITFKNGVASAEESTLSSSSVNADVPVNSDLAGKPVTGKNSFGRNLSGSELKADSIIDVGGLQTTLAAAKAAGLVVEVNGQHYYAGAAPRPFADPSHANNAPRVEENDGAQKQQQQQDDISPELAADQELQAATFDPQAGAVLAEVGDKLQSGEIQSVTRDLVEQGSLTPEAINLVAQRLGVTPEEAAAKANTVHAAYLQQANTAVGPVADAVFDYARTTAPQALKDAINAHVQNGDLSGYRALHRTFIENLDHIRPDFLLSQDAVKALNGRRESDGTLTIETSKGVRTSWKNAIRLGLIPMPSFKYNPFAPR